MRALRLHAFGTAPVIEDVAEPRIVRATDVIVRVGAAGLCRTDLHVLDGVFAGLCAPPPFVMGHETAGWVVEVGSDVEGLAPGDPIIVHPFRTCGRCADCRRGDDHRCASFQFSGAMVDGGFAELMVTTARSVVRIPVGASPADVAGLADGGLAAYRAIKGSIPWLQPGSFAVVIGAGGLGHIAVQVLRAMTPARVGAIDRSPAALGLAATLGAEVTARADGTHVAAIRDATDGRGADVVLDFVGDDDTPAAGLAMLARGGRYVAVGYGGRLDVPVYDLVGNEITVAGSLVGSHTDLVELVALAARGGVHVERHIRPLEAAVEAMDELRAGRALGRIVLVP